MKDQAVWILGQNRIMAIATLRADGWPQNTLVSYVNEDLMIYFIISRRGQKFANIMEDDRVSLVIGQDFHDPSSIKALSIAAHVSEVRDSNQRDKMTALLLDRHPGLGKLAPPRADEAAVMRAYPSIITTLDYAQGFGHADVLTLGASGLTEMKAARADDWGFGAVLKPLS